MRGIPFSHAGDAGYLYGVPRDFGGGGSQPTSTTSTTTQELSPEQRKLYSLVIPKAEEFISNELKLPPGSQIAGFDPLQLAGQQMTINAALGMLPGRVDRANAASDFLLGPALFPETNPALRAATEAAIRPVVQNFEQSVLPQVRSSALQTGGYGGSRQGIAEGIAGQELVRKAGDISSTMAAQAYSQGLDAMTRTLGMQPQLASLALLPGSAAEAVGSSRRALEQAYITEQANRFMQGQMMPFLQAQQVAALAQGIPGGSATTTGMGSFNQPQTSGAQTLMSGLAMAAMIASMFSDRRLKRDVKFAGWVKGVPLYSFRYIWSDVYYLGTIAQELERYRPDAVVNVLGFKFVNYDRLGIKLRTLADAFAYIV